MSQEKSWICLVCGYIHHGDSAPDFCPVCGADHSDFSEHTPPKPVEPATKNPSRWRCINCTYIHSGPNPPDECPVCGAPAERFEPAAEPETVKSGESFRGKVAVIGGGIAGVSAIETVSELAPEAEITLLNRENELPYYRLNLTRFLAGEINRDELPIHPKSWYKERNIQLRTGASVRSITVPEKTIVLDDESVIPFDKLILAAGAHPFQPPIEGAHLENIFLLRTISDAESILNTASGNKKCVCIGGGVLGLEIAGALAQQGVDVTLLERHEWLMPRQLCRTAADFLEKHMNTIGVKVLKNISSEKFLGDETVAAVKSKSGEEIPADLVVIAAGVRPNSFIARKAGIEVNKGTVADNLLQTTEQDIFTAGDVAEHNGIVYGNWSVSQSQGKIAGANAVGKIMEFGGIPRSNTLKVLGIDMLSIGTFTAEDGSYEVLEECSEENYRRFILHDGILVGAILLGKASADSGSVKKAVESRKNLSDILPDAPSASVFAEKLRKIF